jgi:hypothetical protein
MTDKTMLSLVTNWRLDVVRNRTFGVCTVDAPDGFKEHSFKRGFPLTNPTHARCAIFAAVMGLEQLDNSPALSSGKFITAVVTKSKAAADLLIGSKSETVRRWAGDARKKPLKIAGYSKQFMSDFFALLDAVRARKIGDLIYVEAEGADGGGGLLSERTVHLDIDPDCDYEDDVQDNVRMDDAKHRHLLRQELMLSGARGSRSGCSLTKQQRRDVARKEGHAPSKKKEETPLAKKDGQTTDFAARGGTHSGLAAAIAAEELRAATGGDRVAETACAVGDVQKSKPGVGGGGEQAPQGAGELQAAGPSDAEHVQ